MPECNDQMSLAAFHKYRRALRDERGWNDDLLTKWMLFTEEVFEIAEEVKAGRQLCESFGDELADVFSYLFDLADLLGVDVATLFEGFTVGDEVATEDLDLLSVQRLLGLSYKIDMRTGEDIWAEFLVTVGVLNKTVRAHLGIYTEEAAQEREAPTKAMKKVFIYLFLLSSCYEVEIARAFTTKETKNAKRHWDSYKNV